MFNEQLFFYHYDFCLKCTNMQSPPCEAHQIKTPPLLPFIFHFCHLVLVNVRYSLTRYCSPFTMSLPANIAKPKTRKEIYFPSLVVMRRSNFIIVVYFRWFSGLLCNRENDCCTNEVLCWSSNNQGLFFLNDFQPGICNRCFSQNWPGLVLVMFIISQKF